MSVASFIFRTVFAVVTMLVLGLIGLFGYLYAIEPIGEVIGGTNGALGGASANDTVMAFSAIAILSMMLFLLIWYVYAPIRRDKRQELGR